MLSSAASKRRAHPIRRPSRRFTIIYEACSRRGRYNVAGLMAQHGDAKLLYLLPTLTNCPKTESADIYDRLAE